jgi:hypothetical protein
MQSQVLLEHDEFYGTARGNQNGAEDSVQTIEENQIAEKQSKIGV